ncbi:hypothetical protein J6590_023521 [Homalodisca vitripennis]|nr:hypothetical protein J6590_023521 [Homalodisca vitripennis]
METNMNVTTDMYPGTIIAAFSILFSVPSTLKKGQDTDSDVINSYLERSKSVYTPTTRRAGFDYSVLFISLNYRVSDIITPH